MHTHNKTWLLAAVVTGLLLAVLVMPQMVLHPSDTIPELNGDAGKNMFTYLHHVLHDKGFWFTGMNYPYGEHITFADGQPLLSVPLSYLPHITMGGALTVMEWSICISFILAVVYTFRVITTLGARPAVALIASGLIAICAPQMLRTMGHFGLSYACFVPMVFFWTLRYHRSGSTRYAVYIFLLGTLAFFLHPYYCGILFMWVALYLVGSFLTGSAGIRQKLRHALPLILSVVAMFAVAAVVMKLTDPVKDRPVAPFGILDGCTTLSDVFTSCYSPAWVFILKNNPAALVCSGEGACYPGLAVMLIVAVALAGVIARAARRGKSTEPAGLLLWFFMAFVVLLISMGAPFRWHMQWLLSYISFFRQFRAMGRMSWVFYYIITICAVVITDRWARNCKSQVAANATLLLLLLLWGFEASGMVMYIRKGLSAAADNIYCVRPEGDKNLNADLRLHHRRASDFQAIMVLKFFEIGSEKLWIGDDYTAVTGIYTSLQTSLPLMDGMMSRTSWTVAQNEAKTLAGPYARKPVLQALKSDKPILLLWRKQDVLNPDEKYLLTASDSIGDMQNCHVYALYPSRLWHMDDSAQSAMVNLAASLAPGKDTCLKYAGDWYVQHFDTGKTNTNAFFGRGAAPYVRTESRLIAQIPLSANPPKLYHEFSPSSASPPARSYEFSCWFLLSAQNSISPAIRLDYLNESGYFYGSDIVFTSTATDSYGLWFRCSKYVSIPNGCTMVRCTIPNSADPCYEQMDELMFRPEVAVIVSKDADGRVMVNNHRVGK